MKDIIIAFLFRNTWYVKENLDCIGKINTGSEIMDDPTQTSFAEKAC